MKIVHYLISFIISFAMISGMFWGLHTMINAEINIGKVVAVTRIEFSRLRKDSEVQSRREEKAKLQTTAATPSPKMSTVTSSVGTGGPVAAMPAKVEANAVVTTQKIKLEKMSGGSDRDVVPLVRIEPEYPIHAAQQRIEGWVLLRFNISPIGTVKDVIVVDSNPKAVFDETAKKAVLRWKYNPKVENGVAVERRGVEVVLRFQLEKSAK